MQTRAPRWRCSTGIREHVRDPVDVVRDRRPARPACRAAQLAITALVESEQLVGVAMLLVVVDQARVRRRGHDAVVRPAEVELARVAVEHLGDVRGDPLSSANASIRSSVSSV